MKKILSIILAFVIVLGAVPLGNYVGLDLGLQASAIDSRVESAVQLAISIANDNSHGYSQANRKGPDYDCSSLVYYAFSSAGFSLSPAWFATSTMSTALINAGFTELTNINFNDTSNLQRGDILWKSGHTEIYIGNNQMVGAHQSYGYTQTGDQNGKEISVTNYTNNSSYNTNWTKVYRYENDTTPPQKPNLSTNKARYMSNEEITINHWSETAKYYSVSIYKNGVNISNTYQYTGSHNVSFSEPGDYKIVASAINEYGESEYSESYFEIYNSVPNKPNLSSNKAQYMANEEITINHWSETAKYYSVSIYRNGVNIKHSYQYAGSHNITLSEAGDYKIVASAINEYGESAYSEVNIKVYSTVPSKPNLSTNKAEYIVNEDITINHWSETAKYYSVSIYKNGININHSLQYTGSHNITISEAGNYKIVASAINEYGESAYSESIFTVINYKFTKIGAVIDDESKTIYGLEEGVYDLEGYVEYSGCELEYNMTANGFGTGTTVDIVKDGEVVDTYTIVIFGDINGDGYIDAFDVPDVISFVNYESQYKSGSSQEMAADINGDGFVDESDLFLIDLASTFAYTIEQSR